MVIGGVVFGFIAASFFSVCVVAVVYSPKVVASNFGCINTWSGLSAAAGVIVLVVRGHAPVVLVCVVFAEV